MTRGLKPKLRLSLGFNPVGMSGWPLCEVGGAWRAAGAGQAALAVVVAFFLGLLVGFLMAGWRAAGPRRLPLGRPGERPAGFGAAAGEPSAHSSRETPRRTR